MYVSLKRFLAQNIQVHYDENLVPIMVIGCGHDDFPLIKRFCKEVLEDESLSDVFIEDIENRDTPVYCDCEYLLSTDGDYIITDNEWLPINPN